MRVLPCALLVVGLACSDPGPVQQTHQGRLEEGDAVHPQDGSFYDAYTFETTRGASIVLEMHSTDLDSYLLLNGPDGAQIAYNDDATEGDLDARIALTAPADGTYTVFANSRDAGETGAYTLTIEARPAAH